ncbi:hypothetical protein LTR93_012349, partial [Exophiala xenobiotica]
MIGRKHTLVIGAIMTGIGVALQVAASEWIMFLCGRLVNGFGFGMVFVLAPVWTGENVRPELRGFFLCATNGAIVLGQFILSVVAKGTSSLSGKKSYSVVIALQFMFVGFLIIGYPFFPESPYWLLKRGKVEKAKRSLTTMYTARDEDLIAAEVIRLQAAVDFSEALHASVAHKGPLLLQ